MATYYPIAYTIPQYDSVNLKNWWMKAYEQGTTTPMVISVDSAGSTTLAKAELDSSGFPITSGSARFIPHLTGDYDLWLFPTAAEADANDTSNAIQLADNINANASAIGATKTYLTRAAMVADAANVNIDDRIYTIEATSGNGSGVWFLAVDATTVTEDEVNILTGSATVSFVKKAADSADIVYTPAGTGAVTTTAQDKLREVVSVTGFNTIQDALNTGKSVSFPEGSYSLTDVLTFTANNQAVILNAGVTITQTTADKGIFWAEDLDNVWVVANGATLVGEGSWSAAWTGNSGHNDRVVQFTNCTRSGIIKPYIKNGANAGISIVAGSDITIDSPIIEGTHTHGTVLPSEANFQNGIYIKHNPTVGTVKRVHIKTPKISGVAQGILLEGHVALVISDDMQVQIDSPIIRDIPGQHGIYCNNGRITINNPNIYNCDLDGIKIQDNHTMVPSCVVINDFVITNCGSHAIELQATGTGASTVSNVFFNGIAKDCQRGVGLNAENPSNIIENVRGNVQIVNSTQYGLIMQANATGIMRNVDITVDSITSGLHGVFVDGAGITDSKITPRVRDAGTTAANTYDGIHINNCTDLQVWNPDVKDALSNQRYAFFVLAGSVGVYGKSVLQNGTTYSARANVPLSNWPTDVDLGGDVFPLLLNASNFFKSNGVTKGSNQSTSATDVTLWQIEVPDESAMMLQATVVAKLSDSTDRESWVRSCLCYRDAGGNVTIDAQGDIQNLGTSGAVLTWEATGTTIRLRANSGSAVTYDWDASVMYTLLN